MVWLCALRLRGGKDGGVKRIVLLFAALLVAGCDSEKSLLQQAVVIKGNEGLETVYYHADELEPYSGWAKTLHDSGRLQSSGRLKDGNRVGPWTTWDESGQKLSEATYKDGKQHGLWRTWNENGQKESEGTYKADEKEGVETTWDIVGNVNSTDTFKNGEQIK